MEEHKVLEVTSDEEELRNLPDFSELPDIAWVKILTPLSLGERFNVAQTCQRLLGMFKHPSLWHSMKILLLGSANHHNPVIMPNRYEKMVKTVGRYFQDLTLVIKGCLYRMPDDCEKVLFEMGEHCRLQSLTLEVGVVSSKKDRMFGRKPRATDLAALLSLVSCAFRLQSFALKSWPVCEGLEGANIFEALQQNEKIQNLSKLSLFHFNAETGPWATLNAKLPDPSEIMATVQHFTQLEHLCLRSTMMSNSFMQALAQTHRRPLKHLSILVTYNRHSRAEGVPDIASKYWSQLKSHSPKLMVDVNVVSSTPTIELAGLLKPEVPLVSISFMKYSRCGDEDIVSIGDKYNKTLEKFVCYVDDATVSGLDGALLFLVASCTRLTSLVYHGRVHSSSIIALANLRGLLWRRFQFYEGNIYTAGDDAVMDPDKIIAPDQHGQYHVIRSAEDFETMEHRQEVLTDLRLQLQGILEQQWCPVQKV